MPEYFSVPLPTPMASKLILGNEDLHVRESRLLLGRKLAECEDLLAEIQALQAKTAADSEQCRTAKPVFSESAS